MTGHSGHSGTCGQLASSASVSQRAPSNGTVSPLWSQKACHRFCTRDCLPQPNAPLYAYGSWVSSCIPWCSQRGHIWNAASPGYAPCCGSSGGLCDGRCGRRWCTGTGAGPSVSVCAWLIWIWMRTLWSNGCTQMVFRLCARTCAGLVYQEYWNISNTKCMGDEIWFHFFWHRFRLGPSWRYLTMMAKAPSQRQRSGWMMVLWGRLAPFWQRWSQLLQTQLRCLLWWRWLSLVALGTAGASTAHRWYRTQLSFSWATTPYCIGTWPQPEE